MTPFEGEIPQEKTRVRREEQAREAIDSRGEPRGPFDVCQIAQEPHPLKPCIVEPRGLVDMISMLRTKEWALVRQGPVSSIRCCNPGTSIYCSRHNPRSLTLVAPARYYYLAT